MLQAVLPSVCQPPIKSVSVSCLSNVVSSHLSVCLLSFCVCVLSFCLCAFCHSVCVRSIILSAFCHSICIASFCLRSIVLLSVILYFCLSVLSLCRSVFVRLYIVLSVSRQNNTFLSVCFLRLSSVCLCLSPSTHHEKVSIVDVGWA